MWLFDNDLRLWKWPIDELHEMHVYERPMKERNEYVFRWHLAVWGPFGYGDEDNHEDCLKCAKAAGERLIQSGKWFELVKACGVH